MTRRNKIILIISLILIAIIAAAAYSYITAKRAAPDEPVTLREFFSFGTSSETPSPAPTPAPGGAPLSPPQIAPELDLAISQISTRPVAGARAVMVERNKPFSSAVTTDARTPEWTRDLKEGDEGADVRELQVFLNQDIRPAGTSESASTVVASTGAGSPGQETSRFGPATKAAVARFQERFAADILLPQNLAAGTGVADELTRIKIRQLKATLPQKETVLAVRYIDRESGNAYQTFIDAISERRVSNTTIPKIYEALFGSDGRSVLLRFADDDESIVTYAGTLPVIAEGGDSALVIQGGFIEKNIRSLSLSPDGTKFFSITNTEQSAIGTVSSLAGTNRVQVWSSAYTEWLPQWVDSRLVALATKPSSIVPGYLYTLDLQTREFRKVLGDIRGLTTLYSPNGKKILYSRTSPDGNGIILALYDVDAKRSADLGIDTLPEKCAWASDSITLYCAIPQSIRPGQYPDIWYQGVVSFSDTFWKLDTEANLFREIADPSDAESDIDGTSLFLDKSERQLFFTNKKDSTLWHIDL